MWICPNCQSQNEENFCSVCGAPYVPPVPQPSTEKNNRGLIIGCLVVSVIGIVLIILLLVLLLGKEDFKPTGLQPVGNSSATVQVTTEPTSPVTTEAPQEQPSTSAYWFESDREAFLAYVKQQLGVPEDLDVNAEIGDVAYWEGADQWIVHVSFDHNGELVAGASVSPYSGELARSIVPYTAPTKAPSVSYKKYYNGRYGYSIEYPSFLTQASYSQNGDGVYLSDANETVCFGIYGDHMAEFGTTPTLSELKREYKNNAGYYVSYEPMGDNWFVLSGDGGNTVYYEKHFLKSDGTHNQFSISYPKSREKEFDPIITHMVKTFETGIGADSPSAN